MVGVIQASNLFADLYQTHVRIEIAQQIVSFLHDGVEFVAKAKVYGEVTRESPIIL